MTKLENELLLLLAHPGPSENMIKRARELIKGKVKWRYLERAAVVNKVLPYFSLNLEKTMGGMGGKNEEGGEVLRRFNRAKAYQMEECRHLLDETKRMVRALNQGRINYLVVKGQYRALALYRDPLLRYNGDIDLLVPDKGSFASARDVIRGLGYVPLEKTHTPAGQTLERFGGDRLALCDLNTMVSQEVSHYEVIKMDDLWSSVRSYKVGGVNYPVASPENEALMLCLHTMKHENILLRDVMDMCLLVRRFDLDWSEMVRYAKHPLGKQRITAPLQLIDHIARRYYGMRVIPEELGDDFNGAVDPNLPPMVENMRRSLEGTSMLFPLEYNVVCTYCPKCVRCPLIIFKDTVTQQKGSIENVKNKFHRMLWDKMLIFNAIAPTYGPEQTLRSLSSFVKGQVYSISFVMSDERYSPLRKAFPKQEVFMSTSYIGIVDRERGIELRVDGGEGGLYLVMFEGSLFEKGYRQSNYGPFGDLDSVIRRAKQILEGVKRQKTDVAIELPSDMVRVWEP